MSVAKKAGSAKRSRKQSSRPPAITKTVGEARWPPKPKVPRSNRGGCARGKSSLGEAPEPVPVPAGAGSPFPRGGKVLAEVEVKAQLVKTRCLGCGALVRFDPQQITISDAMKRHARRSHQKSEQLSFMGGEVRDER